MSIATPGQTQARPITGDALLQALTGSRIAGLDFLRAIAVLLVLTDHSGLPNLGPLVLFNGGVGVEIFFVLSGFLITWILTAEVQKTGGVNLWAFYRRRAARLLPIFYAYTAFGLVYLTLRHMPIPWGAVAAAMGYVVNYYQAFTGAQAHFLSHCWSLAVEEQFYFIWPFLLLLIRRQRWSMVKSLVIGIALVWVLRPVLMLGFGVPDEYLYRALETRADHLAMGCLLAVLLRTPQWRLRFEKLASVPFILLILAGLLLASSSLQTIYVYKYSVGYALEPLLMAAMIPVVVLKAQSFNWLGQSLNARWLVLIGQASYGMYLLHPIMMHPVRNLVKSLTDSYALGVVASIVALTLIAHWSYKYFEGPVRERLRGA
ncbi:MAG: acyltransferase [Rubrivivax sp.]|nr:MAG: acyltransferase [Rubrivivax sp.]